MSKENEKDLAQETSKVEDVNIKIDASELTAAVKGLGEVVEKMKPEAQIPGAVGGGQSEQDKKDLARYSVAKAIFKQYELQNGRGKLDGVEREMHEEAIKESKEAGVNIHGLGVPSIALNTRADLKATVDASGGYTVATELPGFIDTLKNSMVSLKAGATLMQGLKGDISIPKASTNSTATWRSEGGTATASDPTFTAVTMTPNRLTTYTEFSQQLLRQSSIDIENWIRNNLYYSVANALETAIYEGDGSSNQPTGILNASVNDATHGSSNPTAMSWTNIVNMEKMVAVDNALSAKLAYIMKSTAAAKMKTTVKTDYQGGFLWENFTPLAPEGMVNGYPAMVTNVFTDDTVLFGNWAELMVGQWGGIDLLVNPYSQDLYGLIRVIIAGYYDVAVRHPESFARIDDIAV